MTREGWDNLHAALRLFMDRCKDFLRQQDAESLLREELVSTGPYAALMVLMSRSPQYKSRFAPEILEAILRGPHQSLVLARDVLRSLPRTVLEEQVPGLLAGMLEGGDDHEYSRAAEIVVELRLDKALVITRTMGLSQLDADIREIIRDLENVEHDPLRWGRLVHEWPLMGVENE